MQTRIDPKAKTALFQFDSLYELEAWIDRTPRVWGADTSERDYGHYAQASWDLNAGYAGARALARNGWIEGAQRVQEALKAFTPNTPQPDTKTDVYGFRPHVPRFCAGAPDSMIRHANVATLGCGKVLTLVVPLFLSAFTEAQYASNFGVAVAQYVNQLETDGTRVELIGCFTQKHENSGWHTSHSFTIKNADQPLDLAVVAFALGHPAMFRRIGFALQERSDPVPTDSVYGYPVKPALKYLINPPPGAVILDGMNDANKCARTPEAGLAYVAKKIEKAIADQEAAQ
jgi:hypothetical protein